MISARVSSSAIDNDQFRLQLGELRRLLPQTGKDAAPLSLPWRKYDDVPHDARDQVSRLMAAGLIHDSAGDGGARHLALTLVAIPLLAPPTPNWDGRVLRLGDRVVKELSQQATSQRLLLDAFQQSGWAPQIDNPFKGNGGNAKRQLRQTVESLNEEQGPARIRFHANRGGCYWEIVDTSDAE